MRELAQTQVKSSELVTWYASRTMTARDLERKLLETYRDERDVAVHDLEDARSRVERYDSAIRALEAVMGDEPAEPRDAPLPATSPEEAVQLAGAPKGEEAVRRVLLEDGGRGLTAKELTEALKKRGWMTPNTKYPTEATRAAARRLVEKQTNFKYDGKRFYYRPNPFVPERLLES